MIRSFAFLVFAEVVFNISNYVLQIGQGRILGEAGYGRVTIVVGFITMITIVLARGIPTAMSKRISENVDDLPTIKAIRKRTTILQFFAIATVTTIVFLCAPLIARLFGDPTLTNLFRIAALIIPTFAIAGFYVQYFNGIKDFTAMSTLKSFRGIMRVIFILSGAYFYGVLGAVVGAIIAPLALSTIGWLLDFFRHGAVRNAQIKKDFPKEKLLNYAGGFILFLFLYELYVRTDIYMIKILTGDDAAVGAYNAAMTLSLAPYFLFFALTFLLFPTISTLVKDNQQEKIQKLLTNILRLLWIALLPIALLMAIYAPQIVTLFFGDTFVRSATLMPLMLGGTIFGTFFYVLASVFNGAGKTKIPATIAGIGITGSIVLNSIFLPTYGITATAMILSTTMTIAGIISLIMIARTYKAFIPLRTFFFALIATAGAYMLTLFLPHGAYSFMLSSAIVLCVYGILAFLSGQITQKDLRSSQK